jgi:beta-lactamase regulating signal transducer with metallopeptidase domain
MNSFIETLNQWGGNLLNLAWPILWQSSLLIALVLALDFWLARKIRASIRYALWLAVLVKLLLPPTLALPTSAAWWLFHSQPAIGNASAQKYVVTYGSTAPQTDFIPQMSPVRAPESKLDGAGAVFLGSITVSAGLLVWLVFRWRQVTRKVRGATVSPECDGTLEAARQMAGLDSRVRLNIVEGQMSPAVCGLFNPVILLPRTLVEKLSAGQLRAVLLHELFHLRRKDVWVNCAQALLQIVYWWHPLLWLANARIRRVREEAVDDAVMLALREEAEDYPPTLLEVARLAFRRPRLSLGLVGIMESRSALQQRIERLVNFRAPRKAGLTFLSICGIFVFSAVALPMGEAPTQGSNSTLSAITDNSNQANLNISTTNNFSNSPTVIEEKAKADRLVQDARLLYEKGKFNEAEKLLKSALALDSENGAAKYYLELTQVARQASGIIQTGPARREILAKLNQIHLARFGPFDGLTLDQVVQNLNDAVKQDGIRLTIASGSNSSPATIDPVTGRPAKQTELVTADAKPVTIHLFPGMENVSLSDALDAVISGASRPVEYSIHEDGIVFSEGASHAALLFMRTFYVNPRVFLANLQKQTGPQTNIAFAVSQLLSKAGVELVPPKAIFYNDRLGMLFVRATQRDLDAVEKIIQNLADAPPQIHIKARFIELSGSVAANLYLDSFNAESIHPAPDDLPQPNRDTLNHHKFTMIGSWNTPFKGIMTEAQFHTALRTLESTPGVEELAEPEVTTISGRQIQMRATTIITVITNVAYQKTATNSSITPQMDQVETGPVLEVVPYVLSDGYTINLKTTASLTDFLGYDKPPVEHIPKGDTSVHLQEVLPGFRVQQATANLNLWDKQTIVLGKLQKHFYVDGKEVGAEPDYFVKTKKSRGQPDEVDKELLVFITVTLVDPAGNRIHSDEEMPFVKDGVPVQPPQ